MEIEKGVYIVGKPLNIEHIDFLELIEMIKDNKTPERIFVDLNDKETIFIWEGLDYITEEDYGKKYNLFERYDLWEMINLVEISYIVEAHNESKI